MKLFTIALDWRPNTNHTGFYVAQALGYFKAANLEVTILSAEEDNYATTPAKKLETGKADFALCPMESIVSYRTKAVPFDAIAIATIFQEDCSAIATLAERGIDTPAALDNKKYASYKARYEDQIVQTMIKNAGGLGTIDILYPEKLGIWNTLLNGKADATWIFTNWEGIEAKNKGVRLNLFKMKNYNIPYSYSPVIMASEKLMNNDLVSYAAFMKAVKKGFQYTIKHPKEAALILEKHISESDKTIDLIESQIMSSGYYGNSEDWGHMDLKKIQEFLDWLKNNGLETTTLKANTLATNKLL